MKHNALVLTAELHRQHSLLHSSALQRQIGMSMTGKEGTVLIMIVIALVVIGIAAALLKALLPGE